MLLPYSEKELIELCNKFPEHITIKRSRRQGQDQIRLAAKMGRHPIEREARYFVAAHNITHDEIMSRVATLIKENRGVISFAALYKGWSP
jgi:hypothetical protein